MPDDEYVWVKVGNGRERLVLKSEVEDGLREERVRHRLVNGLNKVTLTEREKKSLSKQLGEQVEDANHAKRIMREKGLRLMERGEKAWEQGDALEAWADGGSQGECPVADPRWKSSRTPVDINEIYRSIRSRNGR